MTQISSILNHYVLSRKDCARIGNIENVYFDAKCRKIVYFAISTQNLAENKTATTHFVAPFSDICAFGDALMLDDSTPLMSAHDIDFSVYVKDLTAKPVYTLNGEDKGYILDINFDDKGRVTVISTTSGQYSSFDFYGINDIALLKSPTQISHSPKKKIPRPKKERLVTIVDMPEPSDQLPQSNEQFAETSEYIAEKLAPQDEQPQSNEQLPKPIIVAEILSAIASSNPISTTKFDQNQSQIIDTNASQNPIINDNENTSQNPIINDSPNLINVACDDGHTPPRIICDYSFLLNRHLVCDLKTYMEELLAESGSLVTTELVEKARKCGKLIDLTLNSK